MTLQCDGESHRERLRVIEAEQIEIAEFRCDDLHSMKDGWLLVWYDDSMELQANSVDAFSTDSRPRWTLDDWLSTELLLDCDDESYELEAKWSFFRRKRCLRRSAVLPVAAGWAAASDDTPSGSTLAVLLGSSRSISQRFNIRCGMPDDPSRSSDFDLKLEKRRPRARLVCNGKTKQLDNDNPL